jgi:hypothetical protein
VADQHDQYTDTPYLVAGGVLLVGLAALAWVTLSVSEAPPEETPPPPPPPPPVPHPAPLPPTRPRVSGAYLTQPDDIGDPVWGPLGSDKEIAVFFPDKHTGGYARASYASTFAAAARFGGSLPTHDDMITLADQAKAAGLELDPVILPGASPELMAEGAKPGDPAMATEKWVRIAPRREELGRQDARRERRQGVDRGRASRPRVPHGVAAEERRVDPVRFDRGSGSSRRSARRLLDAPDARASSRGGVGHADRREHPVALRR